MCINSRCSSISLLSYLFIFSQKSICSFIYGVSIFLFKSCSLILLLVLLILILVLLVLILLLVLVLVLILVLELILILVLVLFCIVFFEDFKWNNEIKHI